MAKDKTALIVIDLPEAMRADRDAGYPWANPTASETAGRVLVAFRAADLPVFHVHHHATNPEHGFHRGNPFSAATPEVTRMPGETVVVKLGYAGIIGTGLESLLKDPGELSLVIVCSEANMCVESTAIMAGDLGFKTTVVADALVNFQRKLRRRRVMPPEDVLEISMANLTSFVRIADRPEVLSEVLSQP